MTEGRRSGSPTSQRELYVAFEIQPAAGSDCPLGSLDGDVREVRQQITGDTCQLDATIHAEDCACLGGDTETGIVHATTDVDEGCPCEVFGEFDCVPRVTQVAEDHLVIETYLPDREHLTDLVGELRAVSDRLRLRQLAKVDAGTLEGSGSTVTLDLRDITPKQREAIVRAVAEGFYERPQQTSLGDLASEFDITKSALSQRLRAAESKLATAAFADLGSVE